MSNLRLLFSDNNAATADSALHCVFRKTPSTQGGRIWKAMKLNAMKLLPLLARQIDSCILFPPTRSPRVSFC